MFISPLLTTRPFFYSHSQGQIDCIGPLVCHSPSLHHVFFFSFYAHLLLLLIPPLLYFLAASHPGPLPFSPQTSGWFNLKQCCLWKGILFSKTICVYDATGTIMYHQSQQHSCVFEPKPKYAIRYMLYSDTAHNSTNQPIYLMSNKKSNII